MSRGTVSAPAVLCCAVLAAAGVSSGCANGSRSVSPSGVPVEVRRVVVLGDSLAVSPSREESFPAVLQRRIAELDLPWTVTNAGAAGDTTAGGFRRVEALLADDVGVLVLALGANDGLRGVELAAIEKNLSAIVERAQARGIAVLLCGMETPPLHGLDYTLGFHDLFPRLASRYGVPLVPFLLSGVLLNPDLNGSDGIHPNRAGAERIARNVWPHLEPLVGGGQSRSTSIVAR
jgi:acyl-CoA thioesterase-1